jgi:ribosomal protein S12 methylthiotransferase accessory factor
VSIASFADEFLTRIEKWEHAQGRIVHLLDLRSDLDIPVFAAVSWRRDGGRIAFGFAADFDARGAARRAMAEMEQFRTFAEEAYLRHPIHPSHDERVLSTISWLDSATIAEEAHFVPTHVVHRYRDKSGEAIFDPSFSVSRCIESCKRHGLDLFLVDMTRPGIDVPVVRVVVPGLLHFWARFGNRRLFEAPVRLGWRATPSEEGGLNPRPLFF